MAKTYDIVHIRNIEGRDKPVYANIGILVEKDDGKRSIKLNSVPVGWDGWAQVFEKREKEQVPPPETPDSEPF